MTYEKIFARMSGHFLCKQLPDDWNDWPEEKLDKFFEDNEWEALEYWDINAVYGMIDAVTVDVIDLMSKEPCND